MNPKLNLLAFALVTISLNIACDKVCKSTVNETATIENLTGREQAVTFCKNPFSTSASEATITISQNRNSVEVALGSRDGTSIQGGPGKCEAKDETEQTQLAISKQSSENVRLCRETTSDKYVLIETYQMCPTGFQETFIATECSASKTSVEAQSN